ncbi:hypothetical protein NRIC_17270 [Enterococcus florum]|uniref:Uncharacterized protein n=1 Tax=Enterococcus florum TaxID=2480627 RepID=A0A4P5P8H7_9ENTE|nr:hypothetical protein [Enterococcus florum]GCF93836.1 hypothetical protein NRIC_17270 [Enterococcus florum]
MEKLTRELNELSILNAELDSLATFLTEKPALMNKKALQIFILDLRDYVAEVGRISEIVSSPTIEQHEPREINHLLTKQNELMKVIRRDFLRVNAGKKTDEKIFGLGEKQIEELTKQLDALHVLNQFLLQDNLSFQAMIESISLTSNIRVGKKQSFMQRLFKKKG